jgi:hypothetical protein
VNDTGTCSFSFQVFLCCLLCEDETSKFLLTRQNGAGAGVRVRRP